MRWFHSHRKIFCNLILVPIIWLFVGGPAFAQSAELREAKVERAKQLLKRHSQELLEIGEEQNHLPGNQPFHPQQLNSHSPFSSTPGIPRPQRFGPQATPHPLGHPNSPVRKSNNVGNILNLISSLFVSEAYAGPPEPLDDDLNETLDARFTQAIIDQAAALDNDPLKIFNWVRNNIKFVPTYGSIYGAELCMQRKEGNAFDTASLLIALYRVSSIPAHYVKGRIQVPIDKAMDWLAVETPEAALAALVAGNIPATFVTDSNGTVTAIQMEHVWVSAYVDYIPSRAEVVHQGDQYVVMDPSYKMVDEAGDIVPEEYPILLGTLPYPVLEPTQIYSALPESLRPGADPPVVNIISVTDTGSGQAEVRGSVADTNLAGYTLEYGLDGSDVLVPLASGTDPVDGLLGTLDSTVLENGIYTIKLSATDAFGTTTSISTTYEVTGQLKIGRFSLAFNDLTIPVSGIPITVTRTYSSFDKSKGSFGVGWSLHLSDIKLQEDENHNVILTLPDGRRARFSYNLEPSFTFFFVEAKWVPESGVYDSLEMMGDNKIVYDAYHQQFLFFNQDSDIPYECYEIPGYILTLKDGTKFHIEKEILGYDTFLDPPCGRQYYGPIYGDARLTKIEDRNGNTLTFTDNGIVHSSGKEVLFDIDENNRISKITDPMGNYIAYEYDEQGDLVKVTDQENHSTQFTYDDKHNLIDIIDARGVRAMRTEYDDKGRMIATVDADGNRIELDHDTDNKTEIVRDQLGNPTIYEYDDKGNVISETNALGYKTQYTYDEDGNKLSETNALGHTTTYTYDAQGNQLTKTDPLGNVTTNTYDGYGNLLTTKDPLNNVTENTYDTRGNLLSTTAPDGTTTSFTYNAGGNLLTITDAAGNLSGFGCDGSGNLISKTDAAGHVTSFTYDDNGNRLTETTTYTTPDGVRTVTTQTEYDDQNRVVKVTDTEGNSTLTEYDEAGQRVATVDPLGRRTQFVYDQRGLLTGTLYPDDTPENNTDNPRTSSVHDAAGREVTTIDELGRETHFVFDAIGQLQETVYPDKTPADLTDNPRTITEYDAAGRVTARIDERGNRTEFTYDDAGRQTKLRDALGNEISTVYDAAGRQVSQVDALGHTTSFTYDATSRPTTTTFADGTSTSTTFDGIGRVVGRTDQAGRTTGFEYDALGRLTAVVDTLGQRTEYAYDEMGNLVRQTDANGHSTTYAYDALGRRVATILPLGQRSTTTYDAVGNVASTTDFNGQTMSYVYDMQNRLIEKHFADGSVEAFTYTDNGLRSTAVDARGTTTWIYDERNRLSSRIDPDGRTISYTYDDAGNRTAVTIPSGTTAYAFDALNRLKTVTDPDSIVTMYHYNAASNLVRTDFPNNTVATRSYDDLNRVRNIATNGPNGAIVSYEYQLDDVGNRTSVTEQDGRRVEYEYDALYRLVSEKIFNPGEQTPSRSIDYTYDPVGNRLSRNDTGEGLTTYMYDKNDRLLLETLAGDVTERTYDDNGNLLAKKKNSTNEVFYHWDQENRRVGVDTNADGMVDVTNIYDIDGIRVAQSVNGEETHFLIDSNRPFAQVLEEFTPGSNINVSYVHGLDLISQTRNINSTNYEKSFYDVDGLGSTRSLTNLSGDVVNRYTYDAFGRTITQIGTVENVYLFAGEQRDFNVGLDYLRARYLDFGTGRFVSRDSFSGFMPEPLTLNGYLYALANPVSRIDPSGFRSILELEIGLNARIVIANILSFVITKAFQAAESFAETNDLQLFSAFSPEDALFFVPAGTIVQVGGRVAGLPIRALRLATSGRAPSLVGQPVGKLFDRGKDLVLRQAFANRYASSGGNAVWRIGNRAIKLAPGNKYKGFRHILVRHLSEFWGFGKNLTPAGNTQFAPGTSPTTILKYLNEAIRKLGPSLKAGANPVTISGNLRVNIVLDHADNVITFHPISGPGTFEMADLLRYLGHI